MVVLWLVAYTRRCLLRDMVGILASAVHRLICTILATALLLGCYVLCVYVLNVNTWTILGLAGRSSEVLSCARSQLQAPPVLTVT